MNLKDKTILLTGATGGIGQELVKLLASKGSNLILLGRNEKKLKDLKSVTPQISETYSVDFTDLDELKNTTETIASSYNIDNGKTIDILINCAGMGIYKSLEDLTLEDWDNSIAVNVTAPFYLIKSLEKSLSNNSIVMNIGSGAGTIGMKDRSAYVASKFAMRGLSLSLYEEYKDSNIHFTLITLGSTLTSFGDLSIEEKKKLQSEGKKYLEPEDVAEKLVSILENDNLEKEYVIYP